MDLVGVLVLVALEDLDLSGNGFFFLGLFVDTGDKVSLDSMASEDFILLYLEASSLYRLRFNGISSSSFSSSSSPSNFSASDLPPYLILRRFHFALFLWTEIYGEWLWQSKPHPSLLLEEAFLTSSMHLSSMSQLSSGSVSLHEDA